MREGRVKDRDGRRGPRVPRKVVRLYPGGPWIWDEGTEPRKLAGRRWLAR